MTRNECIKKVLSSYRHELNNKEIQAASVLNELLANNAEYKNIE